MNALESLGAFGWTLRRRREFRLFIDGFLAYPHQAPAEFYEAALAQPQSLVDLLILPPRDRVIQAIRQLAPGGGTAREAGEWLNAGLAGVEVLAQQYFTHNSILLTHYNKAKHGVTMLRLDEHTHDDFDFQVLAPERDPQAVENGAWYAVGQFSASPTFVGRVRRNIDAVTGTIQQLAIIAWALQEQGMLYEAAELA